MIFGTVRTIFRPIISCFKNIPLYFSYLPEDSNGYADAGERHKYYHLSTPATAHHAMVSRYRRKSSFTQKVIPSDRFTKAAAVHCGWKKIREKTHVEANFGTGARRRYGRSGPIACSDASTPTQSTYSSCSLSTSTRRDDPLQCSATCLHA